MITKFLLSIGCYILLDNDGCESFRFYVCLPYTRIQRLSLQFCIGEYDETELLEKTCCYMLNDIKRFPLEFDYSTFPN